MSLMNIYNLVQEFYAIEAVSAMLTGAQYSKFEPMRQSHSRWYHDFSSFRDEFINRFSSAIYDYTVLVVAAELRYCKCKASHYLPDYYTDQDSRNDVYLDCTVYKADDILRAGIKMFDERQIVWKKSFGGEKWKQIAEAGYMKGKINDCVFIDHCVDLSHNNSVYFDKSAGIFRLQSAELYQSFLEKKRYCEPHALIKNEKGYMLNKLLWRARNLNVIKDWNVDSFFSSEYDETESLLFCYRPIQWGDMPLDCSEFNVLFSNGVYMEAERDNRREYIRCA